MEVALNVLGETRLRDFSRNFEELDLKAKNFFRD